MLLNPGVGEHSWESLGKQGDPTSHTKGNQPWTFIGGTDAEAEAPVLWLPDVKSWHWKRPWCWERLKAGGEGDGRRWDGWMSSLTQWTWVWPSSRNWWWTGSPGMLQSMGSQRVGHDWATELNWTEPMQETKRQQFYPWLGKMPWRRTWQPTRVFLPGESHRQRSLAGYGP